MLRRNKYLLALLATASPLATASANPVVANVDLLPHRAHYALSLHNGAAANDIRSVRGLLVMETRKACEGHISNQELAFVADLNSGVPFSYSVRFSSWESLELDQLRFTVQSYNDGKAFEEFEGHAEIGKDGSKATYSKPEDISLDLPEGTMFPTEHMQKLIESAKAGKLVVNSQVFDGSGPDALTSVTAVIGSATTVAAEADMLAGETSWPVSLAYYSLNTPSDLPEFEISFKMTAEGVLHDLVLDYGDFALAAELTEIEPFDDSSC